MSGQGVDAKLGSASTFVDGQADDTFLPGIVRLQAGAARSLIQSMRHRRSHAFMLSGARGLGAEQAAEWMAQRVLCPSGGCTTCEVCQRVARRVHPDLMWISAEGDMLRNESVDAVARQLARTPFEAAAQVVVIEDADTLNDANMSTANRLLTLLEEPTGDVVFVLLATQPDKIIATIRSRVLEVRFVPLAATVVDEWLAQAGVPDVIPATGVPRMEVVRASRGNILRAQSMIEGDSDWQRLVCVSDVLVRLTSGALDAADAAEVLANRVNSVAAEAQEVAELRFAAEREQMTGKDATRMKNTRDADGHEARVKRMVRRAVVDEMSAILDDCMTWYRDILACDAGAESTLLFAMNLDAYRTAAAAGVARSGVSSVDVIEGLRTRLHLNVDMKRNLHSMCAELASLGRGIIRARRMLGVGARTQQGYEIQI